MADGLALLFDDKVRGRIVGIYAVLIAANVAAWAWALFTFRHYPGQLWTALLAYTFGLRHAVDADHIAAIDNVTRKLMQEGERPVGVGFFFSLGHSTIVVLASIAIAATATAFKDQMAAFQDWGGLVGTLVSTFFLLAIAIMNIFILIAVYRKFQHVRTGGAYVDEDLDLLMVQGGMMARVFRPMFRLITRSWQMYPLGFLFGLGFDTATEVGLLGLSAAGASQGLPIWSILVFPALFTVGMSLVDTTDSVLMLGAYGWAFVKPIRKLYYNMTITAVSVVVALAIGSLEALNLLGDRLRLKGASWEAIGKINDNFGTVGFMVVGVFLGAWIIAFAIYRANGYDDIIEATPNAP